MFAAVGTDVHLLPGCRLSGRYQYLGVNPQQQHVALTDDAQVRVNLALDAATPPPRSPLTLDLVYVGSLATTRRSAAGAALTGSCAGATHFARTLSVGEAGPGPGGVDRRAGCAIASAIDVGPPARCQRFLRAELVALRDGTFDTAKAGITFCPPGWAQADGVCARRASAVAYECGDDPKDCRAQCERGSAPSCTRLGYALANGEAGFVRDEKQALTLYERACAAGYPPACFNLGVLYWSAGGVPKSEALADRYWERACTAGYAAACSNLGVLNMRAASRPTDARRAFAHFSRACAGGEPHGCLDAVQVLGAEARAESGSTVEALLAAACDGDVAGGCLDLSIWLSKHGAPARTATDLVEKACRLGSQRACELSSSTKGI